MYSKGMEKMNWGVSAQSDEDIRYPLTESFRSVEYINTMQIRGPNEIVLCRWLDLNC